MKRISFVLLLIMFVGNVQAQTLRLYKDNVLVGEYSSYEVDEVSFDDDTDTNNVITSDTYDGPSPLKASAANQFDWENGFIYYFGESSNPSYRRSSVILLKAGETISFVGGPSNAQLTIYAVAKVLPDGRYAPIISYEVNSSEIKKIVYTAREDINIVISTSKEAYGGQMLISDNGDTVPMPGTESIDLQNYYTREQVDSITSKIYERISELLPVESEVSTNWHDGFIYYFGESNNSAYQRTSEISLKTGETISFTGGSSGAQLSMYAIAKLTNEGHYVPVITYDLHSTDIKNIEYTANEDMKIIISTSKQSYGGKIYKTSAVNTPKELESLINNYNALGNRMTDNFGGAALSWIDDDFAYNNHRDQYNALYDFCIENGIYPDIAFVPSETDKIDGRGDVIKQWYKDGFGVLYHPVHEKWFNEPSGKYQRDVSVIRKSMSSCMSHFVDLGLGRPSVLVYPGNSGDYIETIEIIKDFVECGVCWDSYFNSNHKTDHGRYGLRRLNVQLAQNNKSAIKAAIKAALDNGDWVILGGHVWEFEVSDVLDETSMTTANLFDIISYANSLCKIRPVESVWREKRPMFDANNK